MGEAPAGPDEQQPGALTGSCVAMHAMPGDGGELHCVSGGDDAAGGYYVHGLRAVWRCEACAPRIGTTNGSAVELFVCLTSDSRDVVCGGSEQARMVQGGCGILCSTLWFGLRCYL